MSNAIKVKRGEVVLLPISLVSGTGTKVRPALVVQDDSLNSRLNSTVVAIITTTNKRAANEPSQLFIDVATPHGRITGLLHNSTVKGEHVDTVDQRDVLRVIGRFSDSLMQQVEVCIKSALRFS